MVIALFALAFAMIVGGLFAAILGWDIVLVERGWTMVIAGSISAASGALLLGVAAVVSRLSHIQAELMRLQANLVEDEEPANVADAAAGMSLAALAGGLLAKSASEAAPSDVAEAAKSEQPSLPLFGETASSVAAPEAERPPAESEVVPEPPPAPREGFGQGRFFEPRPVHEPEAPAEAGTATSAREEAAAEEGGEPEVRIPDFLIAERYRETTYTEFSVIEPEPAGSSAEPTPEPETPSIVPGPEIPTREDDIFEPEPSHGAGAETGAGVEAPLEEQAAAEPESGATVIGTYNSGDNRYVMYSDGSIEAETPQGMFKFKSLDELKEFIATGEGGTRLT